MTDRFNQPSQGTKNWDEPLNENFADLGVEVAGQVATWDDLPAPSGATSSNGNPKVYRVKADGVFVRDATDSWAIIGGLGSADHPLPPSHHEAVHAGRESITDDVIRARGEIGTYEDIPVENYEDIGAAIQAANDALSGSGKLICPSGDYTAVNGFTLNPSVIAEGSGITSTKLIVDSGISGPLATISGQAGLTGLSINAPDEPTDHLINIPHSGSMNAPKGFILRDIRFKGATNNPNDKYAINVENAFEFRIDNIQGVELGMNGLRFVNSDDAFNYGNALISQFHLHLDGDGLTGVLFRGSADSARNVNLVTFAYLGLITGQGSSNNVGVDLAGAPNITFVQPDIEGFDLSMRTRADDNGTGVSGVSILGPYFDGEVKFGSDTIRPTILGGRVMGTLTQFPSGLNKRVAKFYGTTDNNGDPINFDSNSGAVTFSGDGSTTSFSWQHDLRQEPTTVSLEPLFLSGKTNEFAINDYEVLRDYDNVTVLFESAPASGTDNIGIIWRAEIDRERGPVSL